MKPDATICPETTASFPNKIHVIDSHTGGEPTRVIVSGGPDLGKGSMVERLELFRTQFDAWRRGVLNEPRGNDVIVGAIILPAVNADSIAATIYYDNIGYLGMCGHGTIGLTVTLAHLGRIQPGEHRIDTPVGQVRVVLHDANTVSVQNVASFRYRESVAVNVPGIGRVVGDIASGGNWFYLVRETETAFGEINPGRAGHLLDFTKRIRSTLMEDGVTGENGVAVDHVELYAPPGDLAADSRNFVLCPGGAWDRSPCGTGTSAKLACLAADGKLKPGEVWRQASTTGSIFETSFQWEDDGCGVGKPAHSASARIIPTIRGSAWISGDNKLFFDPTDPFRFGIGI